MVTLHHQRHLPGERPRCPALRPRLTATPAQTLFLFLSRYALPRFPLEVSAQVNYVLAVVSPAALLAARALRYF